MPDSDTTETDSQTPETRAAVAVSPRESARVLWLAGMAPASIARVVGCPAGSVRAWAVRHSWPPRPDAGLRRVAPVAVPSVAPDPPATVPATLADDTAAAHDRAREVIERAPDRVGTVIYDPSQDLLAAVHAVVALTRRLLDQCLRLPRPETWREAREAEAVLSSLHRRLVPERDEPAGPIIVLGAVESVVDEPTTIDVESA